MREIRRGQQMRPELNRLVASSTVISSSRYTPFYIDTSATDTELSLRPVGDAAELPSVIVAEQKHTIVIPDYGLTLKASYKALRYRTTPNSRSSCGIWASGCNRTKTPFWWAPS